MPTTLTLHPTGQVLTVPTSWADVSLAQFVDLQAPEEDDERRPAETLLGLAAGELDQLAADDVAYLSNLLAFSLDASDVLALLPTPVLPSVGSMPYGTLLMAQNRIKAHEDRPWYVFAPYLLALYRIEHTYGKYDSGKVKACEAALLASPVTEVWGDAAFFLSSYRAWQQTTHRTPTTSSSPKTKKSKPAAKTSPSSSGRFSAWMRRLKGPS